MYHVTFRRKNGNKASFYGTSVSFDGAIKEMLLIRILLMVMCF